MNRRQISENFGSPKLNMTSIDYDKYRNLNQDNYDPKERKRVSLNENNANDKQNGLSSQKNLLTYEEIMAKHNKSPTINKLISPPTKNKSNSISIPLSSSENKGKNISDFSFHKNVNVLPSFNNTQNNLSTSKVPGVFVQPDERRLRYVEENYEDGTKYIGEKYNDFKHGRGQFYYSDGTYYDGEWEMNKKSGYGIITSKDCKTVYDGEWLDDSYHGNGVSYNLNYEDLKYSKEIDYKDLNKVNKNWIKYEGEFLAGKRHGMGSLQLVDNYEFSGKFKNNLANGAGKFYFPDQSMVAGDWENNKFIGEVSKS